MFNMSKYTSDIEKSGLPFNTPLTADDLRENLHESDTRKFT